MSLIDAVALGHLGIRLVSTPGKAEQAHVAERNYRNAWHAQVHRQEAVHGGVAGEPDRPRVNPVRLLVPIPNTQPQIYEQQ